MAPILPEIRPCSDCPAPTLSQTSIGRPPKFQLSSPGTGQRPALETAKKAAGGAHWLENAPRQERESLRQPPRRQVAKAGIRTGGEACPSSRTAGTGRQGRKVQRWRGIRRLGRDLHDAGPAQLRDRARRFSPIQSGWPIFFALTSSFSRETEFTQIRQREDRHSPCPSHFKSASDPDAEPTRAVVRAVTATKHEPGLSP